MLYCFNPDCIGISAKVVEHFSKTLKIKGLGPASIQKLGLSRIRDIYDLSIDECILKLNSEALGTSVYTQIQESKEADLSELLPAFSIPLVGKTATAKLCKVIDNIYDLSQEVCKDAGLGPKATGNLLGWMETDFLVELCNLPFRFTVDKQTTQERQLLGVVCISGKLNTFPTKAEAEKALEEKGYIVKSSLTKEVTILVNESGVESSKTKKARDNGVSIINNLSDIL